MPTTYSQLEKENQDLREENRKLRSALKNLAFTARTFRNVPKEEQEWTIIDEDALDDAFEALGEKEI